MRTFRLRSVMKLIAITGIGCWLLRDYPAVLLIVLGLAPTYLLTSRFLQATGARGRKISLSERLAAWLLVSSVTIPLEFMGIIAVMLLLGLIFWVASWLLG